MIFEELIPHFYWFLYFIGLMLGLVLKEVGEGGDYADTFD